MPYYKAQHEVFIHAIIRHGDQLAAYRQAYPKASKESAYTAAIRLMRQPHIQARVAVAMEQHALREREREREREELKRKKAEEDTLQKRRWLARVVRGEVEKQRYMQFKGRTILVHETLNTHIILAAIELDTRYEYSTNPKIILDRQFARLYERAMRPVGVHWVNRLMKRPVKAVISNEVERSVAKREISREHAIGSIAALQEISRDARNDEFYLAEKNTQNASKKLTDSKQSPRPAIHPASNIPAVCNKVKGRPAPTAAALMTPAKVHPAHYTVVSDTFIKAVISNEVERSVAKRESSREHAIGSIAALQEISRDGRNDGYDWATSDTAIKAVISNGVQNSGTQREISREYVTGHIAELQEISPRGRNDDFDWAKRKPA